jgi:hypothetical protein
LQKTANKKLFEVRAPWAFGFTSPL